MEINNVSNYFNLDNLLEERFKDRYKSNFLALATGKFDATLDSKKFTITYLKNNYLLISASPDSDIIKELTPTLNELMNNTEAICSYDLQCEGFDIKDSMPTLEWDIKNPDERIRDIVNGRAFSSGKIHNLKLLNGKKIEDYVETEEEKKERIKNAKIYGIYPGSISDVDKINNLNEVELYHSIDSMGALIWRLNHEMSHGRIEQTDLTELQYGIEYMVYQTTKFGVELDEPQIDKHITPSPSYLKWYKFYDNHFKNVLTNEEWDAYQEAKSKGEDISCFMPTGKWNDDEIIQQKVKVGSEA